MQMAQEVLPVAHSSVLVVLVAAAVQVREHYQLLLEILIIFQLVVVAVLVAVAPTVPPAVPATTGAVRGLLVAATAMVVAAAAE